MLTLTEAAAELGISAATLRHQVQLGRMTARLFGKTYVITDQELERYRATSLGRPGRPSHRSAPRLTR
jgi:excisionase family DNA binding protein